MGAEDRTAQVRAAERFNEQCFLIDNWKQIVPINIRTADQKPYEHFTTIEGDPGIVTHELVGKKEIEPLLEIRTEAVSLLLPRIKITKLEYPSEDTKVPIEKILLFKDHTSPRSIENITKSRIGRGDEVGLKSFSYELAGKNVAEGGIARCTLKIFFQNVASLVSDAPDDNHAAFKDLIINEPKYKNKIIKDANGQIIKKEQIYNSKHFRIKIETGWSDPIDPTQTIISASLKEAIRKSRTILFMTLLKHNLDFKQDGSVELTLEYQGAMEAALNNKEADILKTTKRQSQNFKTNIDRTATNRTIFDKRIPSLNPTQAQLWSQDVPCFYGIGDKEGEQRQDVSQQVKIDNVEVVDKQEKYSKMLNDMIKTSRMYYVDVDQEHIKGFTDEVKKKLEEQIQDNEKYSDADFRRAQKLKLQIGRRKHGRLKIHRINDSQNFDRLRQNNLTPFSRAFELLSLSDLKSKEEVSKLVTQHAVNTVASTPKKNKNQKRINFFFFGDLLEIALKTLFENESATFHNMRILLGPITFKDPRRPNAPAESINLADIPISLNLFITWYMKEVVAPLRERYFFGSFIKDVINTLIVPALGEDCIIIGQNQQHNVSMTFFSLPGIKAQGRTKTPIPSKRKGESRNTAQSVKQQRADKLVASQFVHQNTKDLYHYMYIYVSSRSTSTFNGERKSNIRQGIYHIFPAADRGLVKSINFKKEDQPFVAEMRATQDSEDTKRLRDRYNCSVVMIGNSLFKPGQYVYIDTERFGLGNGYIKTTNNCSGDNNSVAKQLGLGGYYQVVKVTHNVGKDDYETELDCRWIFNGGEKKDKSFIKIKQDRAYNSLAKSNQLSRE